MQYKMQILLNPGINRITINSRVGHLQIQKKNDLGSGSIICENQIKEQLETARNCMRRWKIYSIQLVHWSLKDDLELINEKRHYIFMHSGVAMFNYFYDFQRLRTEATTY